MRTLLLGLALNLDLHGLRNILLGLFLILLTLQLAVGDELLHKTKARGQSPVQDDTSRRDPRHVDEHQTKEDEHHPVSGLGLRVGVLLDELITHRADRQDDEEDGKDAVNNVEASLGDRKGQVRQQIVEADDVALVSEVHELPTQGLEQDDEDRHLNKHGHATSQRVEPDVCIDLHGLLGDLLLVAGILLLDLGDLRLHLLHSKGRAILLCLDREKHQANDEGDDDDRQTPVTHELCKLQKQPCTPVKNSIPHVYYPLS